MEHHFRGCFVEQAVRYQGHDKRYRIARMESSHSRAIARGWGAVLVSEGYPPRVAPGVGAELSPRHRVHPPAGQCTLGDSTTHT